MSDIIFLVISLGIILVGAELFVNGVEWLGKLFNLSEGAVGSVLAAVGTALPETIIPIIAILFGSGSAGKEIGLGAILGAPLMLSTLAMFVTGLAVMVFNKRRTHGSRVFADYSSMSRDLGFFMIVFTVAVLAGTLPPAMRYLQLLTSMGLILGYVWYVHTMLSQERDIESENEIPACYFARHCQAPPAGRVSVQVFSALALIIFGADLFVHSVKAVALSYGVPAFVLALIITPIATELPEKFNSVIWISREKDTLALGNITGAMVFQGSLIPAIGILLTDWQLNTGAVYSAILTVASSSLLYLQLTRTRHVSAGMLLLCGLFYAIFLVAVFQGVITALPI
ncbi:MAG: sodium:calcium antiporter [Syntrophomonadaceae bacterium]|nr:sodium:calcium antiporter [Syntrophomonadaceae bacterium]